MFSQGRGNFKSDLKGMDAACVDPGIGAEVTPAAACTRARWVHVDSRTGRLSRPLPTQQLSFTKDVLLTVR